MPNSSARAPMATPAPCRMRRHAPGIVASGDQPARAGASCVGIGLPATSNGRSMTRKEHERVKARRRLGKCGDRGMRLCGVIAVLMASVHGSLCAPTNDWSGVHVPLIETRVRCVSQFDPRDPSIEVTYSNTSPSNAISIPEPVTANEQAILVPLVSFDGETPAFRNPTLANSEVLPQHGTWIPPQHERTVLYRISWRFVIPSTWQRFTVRARANLELIHYAYTFDRSGKLVERTIYSTVSLEKKRDSICRVPRVRKALLDDTVWSDMTGLAAHQTAAIPSRSNSDTESAAAHFVSPSMPPFREARNDDEGSLSVRSARLVHVCLACGIAALGGMGFLLLRRRAARLAGRKG